jgi:hypothetical protein
MPITMVAWVQFEAYQYGIYGEQVALGQVFLKVLLFSPVIVISTVQHINSFICHQHYLTVAINSVSRKHT